ncbi:MAG: hypothetical protein EXS13_03985 [Planctomycetes bacterium]|nr:hypothetical protein [Planctomycetota bacterium]
MTSHLASRRHLFWTLIVAWDVACVAITAWCGARTAEAWRAEASRDATQRGVPSAQAGDEIPWPQDAQYVVDPVVGHRPKSGLDRRFLMGPLGGEAQKLRRRHDGLGLIRDVEDPTGAALAASPRVLLIGDSHLMGVVANADNAAAVLERRLRAQPTLANAVMLNASAGYYSLWQLVLRARTLANPIAADVLVLGVFLGNDFIELEDVARPHLNDASQEQPPDPKPPAETTSARRTWLGRDDRDLLFWQGLNQACYFHQRPERIAPVVAKARHCIEQAQALTREHNAQLLVALIPSYDVAFPTRAAALGERVAEVVTSGANGRLRAELRALLAQLGIPCIDVLESFQADGRDALYATDYHIFVEGHRLLAEALTEPLSESLAAALSKLPR